MDTWYLHTEHMDVGYDGVPLLRDIEIGVRRGEILTLIGPNGSGKSTILKSMIRQLRLLAGVVVLDGQTMAAMKEGEIAKKMAILMTERLRAELMTGEDVVSTGRYPYTGRLGILTKADREKVLEAIALVHGEEFANRPFAQLSDGQRQRLLLARAVCQEPEVIVLDEPTSFLDVKHKLELLEILKRLVRERNVAVVMSLHELDLAQKISDRVVSVTKDGVDRCDTPENIFQSAYIEALYGMESGSYNALFGSLEMARVWGEPRVFVIGGGGSGIPVYRALQRRGVPFAAGVLVENDVDYWVARALAVETVSVPAFASIDEGAVAKARALILTCDHVVCCLDTFGELNQGNRPLQDEAQRQGKLLPLERLSELWTGGDR
ncbi:MAG: ABC transporter ATP-binding protein [Clostridia bacterium]|nr:ABC transporter ATP-binding protein [Clostridia bacterium]